MQSWDETTIEAYFIENFGFRPQRGYSGRETLRLGVSLTVANDGKSDHALLDELLAGKLPDGWLERKIATGDIVTFDGERSYTIEQRGSSRIPRRLEQVVSGGELCPYWDWPAVRELQPGEEIVLRKGRAQLRKIGISESGRRLKFYAAGVIRSAQQQIDLESGDPYDDVQFVAGECSDALDDREVLAYVAESPQALARMQTTIGFGDSTEPAIVAATVLWEIAYEITTNLIDGWLARREAADEDAALSY